MGTRAVIAVVGFLILFGLINPVLNRNNNRVAESTYGYVKFVAARDIARNAVQTALRKIDTLTIVTSSSFPVSGSIDGGTFTVSGVVLNDSTLRLTSVGKFSDTTYSITTTLGRKTSVGPPGIEKSPIGLYSSPVGFLSGSNDTIDGRDHDMNGNLISGSTPVAAIRVKTKADSTNAEVDGHNTAAITNDPEIIGSPKIMVDPDIPDPNVLGPMYKNIATRTYYGNDKKSTSLPDTTFGSPTSPAIVFCEGNDTQYFGLGGNTRGYGVLVVHGQLKCTGNFFWAGLIIVYGSGVHTFDAGNGNANINGAILLGGAAGSTFKTGNAYIKFSLDAIRMVTGAPTPSIYTIIDWYE